MRNKYKEMLKEAEDMGDNGYVATDDERKAEDLAKKGVKVKLTKEQEGVQFSTEEMKIVAKEVGKVLIDVLREAGDEITTAKGRNIQPDAFELYVKYKNDFEDTFQFYIDQDSLHLVDEDSDKVIGDVGVKPSGEPIIHSSIIRNNLLKHFKSLNEEMDWEDFEKGSREVEYLDKDGEVRDDSIEEDKHEKRQKYLHIFDMYKKLSGKDREEFKPRLEKAAKEYGVDLDLSEQNIEENLNPEVTKLVNRFIGGHAKRYEYDTQSAVYAIITVLRSQEWEGVNEQFNPSIAPGSIYAIEIKEAGNKIALIQDNGQEVVVHKEDIYDLIKALEEIK